MLTSDKHPDVFWQDDDFGDTICLCMPSGGDQVGFLSIVTTARQILKITKMLAASNIVYSIDEEVISVNGGSEEGVINIMGDSSALVTLVKSIIGRIGTVIDDKTLNLPEVRIDGKQVASNRLAIFERAMNLMNTECKKRGIDISSYRVKLSLER